MDNKGLLDRVKSLEQQLKSTKASAAVWKSKAEHALASEQLILDSIKEAADGLLCKNRRAPEPFCL
jgi:phage shock protein A